MNLIELIELIDRIGAGRLWNGLVCRDQLVAAYPTCDQFVFDYPPTRRDPPPRERGLARV